MFSAEALPRPTKTFHADTYERISKDHGFEGKGKTIVITGGASGIGYSISEAFAESDVERIAIIGRSAGPLEKAKVELETAYPSTKVLIFQSSITDMYRMTDILNSLGTVDVLVLCAAVAHRRATASDITLQEMQDALDTNVTSAFNLTKAYLKMPAPAAGRKTIINISSSAAHNRVPFRVAYGPSKAATAQVMQQFAEERAAEDVKIFSFHPGSIYTPGVAANVPKNKLVWEDVKLPAHFTRWLAGPESTFLHGRYVWANWDVDELIALKEKLQSNPDYLTIGIIM